MNPVGMDFISVYERLLEAYGEQHWWPAETPFEVMVGAVLTQNTSWSNVEHAIANLKPDALQGPKELLALAPEDLAQRLKPVGYFNIKAKRLRNLCQFLLDNTDLHRLDDAALREAFLSVNGIGPETADDILLYAFERPVFVIDAYTRRMFFRLGLVAEEASYTSLSNQFTSALESNVQLFNEYHALIVHHAKYTCQSKPRCSECLLGGWCLYRVSMTL